MMKAKPIKVAKKRAVSKCPLEANIKPAATVIRFPNMIPGFVSR
jgi:hypothetical protein